MDSLIVGGGIIEKKTFFNHMFSTTDESKAEFLNIMQYSTFAIIPVVLLNKSVQFIFPELDPDKSSFFILAEIILQIFFIFFGILFIHRFITFFNSFSGFVFDPLSNFILPFLIIIFSFHSKLSNKINLLFFRTKESLGFTSDDDYEETSNLKIYSGNVTNHTPQPNQKQQQKQQHRNDSFDDSYYGPMAANSIIGSSF
jgi:hypothetical protein